jgi:prepilin-type N-terminal cleavage/methylation domain-containing protein
MRPRRVQWERAFTLIELLAVMGVIVLLMGLVLAGAGLASRQADRNRVRAEMEKICTALERYNLEYTMYPTNLHSPNVVRVLTNFVPDLKLTDIWGRAYVYTRLRGYDHSTGNPILRRDAFELRSIGPDGLTNTADDITTVVGQ